MANWVTHLMIADGVLQQFPGLDRRGFCVGNIAPDCNVENEDWTAFTPPRAVTHWMQGERKVAADSDAFCEEYILKRRDSIQTPEQYAFLLGYYSHLITDAAFQATIRDEQRVRAAWDRIRKNEQLCQLSEGMEENWDSIKKLIPKRKRLGGINTIEAEYLAEHPECSYLNVILPLKEFPDYIDYLPHGCIVRKIGVMGYLPQPDPEADFISMSREEYAAFVENAIGLVAEKLRQTGLV